MPDGLIAVVGFLPSPPPLDAHSAWADGRPPFMHLNASVSVRPAVAAAAAPQYHLWRPTALRHADRFISHPVLITERVGHRRREHSHFNFFLYFHSVRAPGFISRSFYGGSSFISESATVVTESARERADNDPFTLSTACSFASYERNFGDK